LNFKFLILTFKWAINQPIQTLNQAKPTHPSTLTHPNPINPQSHQRKAVVSEPSNLTIHPGPSLKATVVSVAKNKKVLKNQLSNRSIRTTADLITHTIQKNQQ
jgi:hypothetical protein